MSRPCETVRTDTMVYWTGEAIPDWCHPKACGVHRVTWWTDEATIEQLVGKVSGCPCCDGSLPLSVLRLLEEPIILRHMEREP